jgi:hypothetical protein
MERCIYPLGVLKKASVQHATRHYHQAKKKGYTDIKILAGMYMRHLLYLDKNHVKHLIDSYNNESSDTVIRACLVWRISDPRCGGRTTIPFLIKVLETDPSWLVYMQARRSLLSLTGLFLGDDKEGPDIKKIILNPLFDGNQAIDMASSSVADFFAKNELREWGVGEKDFRASVVQEWKDWYAAHKQMSTTQWLKESFEIYTKEIEGTWLDPDDIFSLPYKDMRLFYLYQVAGVDKFEYYPLFQKRFEEAKKDGKIPTLLPSPKRSSWEYKCEDNGFVYQEWWKIYGEKIDFIKSISDNAFTSPCPNEQTKYQVLFQDDIYYLYLLCEPKGLEVLIEDLRRLPGSGWSVKAFESNFKITEKTGMMFLTVNPVFDALKDLTGQDFGWNWRKTKEEKTKVVEQWGKWVNENVNYLYWSDGANQFVIDQEAKAAGIPTEEYRKTHPWVK